ncbi:MAG: SIS domain-containing protein [Acidimicrobiia bacterium]
MTAFDAEIAEQPQAARRFLQQADAHVDSWRRLPRPVRVSFVGRGSSGHACEFGSILLESSGIRSSVLPPSVLNEGDIDLTGDWLVAISQSGRTPEVIGALARAQGAGAQTFLFTNGEIELDETTAIDLLAGPERAIPATKTFTNSLLATHVLARALAGSGPVEVPDAPRWIELGLQLDLTPLIASIGDSSSVLIGGRGPLAPIAREVSLKLGETTGMWALGESWNEAQHGPIHALTGVPVILLSPDPAEPSTVAARDRFLSIGCVVRTIGFGGDIDLGVPVSPEEMAYTGVVIGQRLASALCRERGIDPDEPRHLSKVTKTH